MRIEGSGPRTVIFESGLGDTLGVWAAVQPGVAAGCARTVSCDRAGYAGSDMALSTSLWPRAATTSSATGRMS